MKIEDYLHLYLGCEVMTDIGCAKFFRYDWETETAWFVYGVMGPDFDRHAHASEVKPILRPLRSMTDEEKNNIGFEAYSVLRKSNQLPQFQEGKVWAARQTVYLLSKHFDLFGLIDAGLAIDSTKVTV